MILGVSRRSHGVHNVSSAYQFDLAIHILILGC